MTEWQMIGIRVPKGSDLPSRLKELSEKARCPYHELLEKFITQAELETLAEPTTEDLTVLRSRIDAIEARLAALEPSEPTKVPEVEPSALIGVEQPEASRKNRSGRAKKVPITEA